ncbi:hypothetical protein AUEXF2481DRAFT_25341 [Aureobasidium subglaciale EXF-2481]|uniref:Zn(2)-C6 fungal-type domain-containing protein n=1 Tax=Aureobasidium subglaciale (strain EXF-2481) TaxID=1043005 RepID=A0A074YNQ0_AURSE|nr:uncharacterized protein AUEXF2481DRAFT_25341 [Aureobasidium subglaciale EXF-2481]KEQ99433.1 hypothetical protein AUEXF2481DRAFT_25341 [Aureobasidium subglaciale EXF-2481]
MDRSHSIHSSSRRSSGSAKEESPIRGKVKRQQIAVACNACRRRKTKCDGHRPVCSVCVTKNSECTWSADPDATPMIAIKRKYQNLETEARDLQDLVQMLMDRPRKEAIFILDHMRRTRDAVSTLAFIKDGDLLTWGLNTREPHPSQSFPSDHDHMRDITQGVNTMGGKDGPRDGHLESNESITEPASSPKRRLAISDLVNDT